MMVAELTSERRAEALAGLTGWSYDPPRRAFFKHIVCRDFVAAFGLMTRIALVAEKADHHPEWANVYDRIHIWLTTHDVGGVSERDVAMAAAIDRLASAAA